MGGGGGVRGRVGILEGGVAILGWGGRVWGMNEEILLNEKGSGAPMDGVVRGRGVTSGARGRRRALTEGRQRMAVARREGAAPWVVFGALAEEGRWKVARLLGKEGRLSLGEVIGRTGLPKWSASRYLLELWRAGIVDRYSAKEDGRRRVYGLTEVGAGLVQAGLLLEG